MDTHKIIKKTHEGYDNACLGVRNNSIGAWPNFLVCSRAVILASISSVKEKKILSKLFLLINYKNIDGRALFLYNHSL